MQSQTEIGMNHTGLEVDPDSANRMMENTDMTRPPRGDEAPRSAAVRLVADNPGVWMFHCHVIDHMETGLMAAIEVA